VLGPGFAPARILGLRDRAGSMDVSAVCCQVEEVSATGRSLIQRGLTECSVSLCVIYKPLQ
jgi:hypothetical protein